MFSLLKNLGKLIITPWWRTVLLWVLAIVLLLIEPYWPQGFVFVLALFLYTVALMVFSIRCLYCLYHRQWVQAVVHFLLFGAAMAVLVVWVVAYSFIRSMDGDHFAEKLQVPNNIVLDSLYTDGYIGGETNWVDSLRSLPHSDPTLYVYESAQPGLFQYDAWLGQLDTGILYIKAFEITQGTPLSDDRLPESSALPVCNNHDTLRLFSSTHTFTIYEGDWGEPYAARFELWYKPLLGGTEKKLLSKNYRIEGWQR